MLVAASLKERLCSTFHRYSAIVPRICNAWHGADIYSTPSAGIRSGAWPGLRQRLLGGLGAFHRFLVAHLVPLPLVHGLGVGAGYVCAKCVEIDLVICLFTALEETLCLHL